jgi:HEPN domain-containing protein
MVRKSKDVEIAKSYLIEAKTDLESAEILFNKEKYGRVVFFCQQAVEKVIKALLCLKRFRIIKTHEISPLVATVIKNPEVKV